MRSPQYPARTQSTTLAANLYMLPHWACRTCSGSTSVHGCHGDQALIPSEYSDDDVESLSWGPVPVPVPCACAWPCWPAPCFPILSLCFFPPKPQVPGSEVELWLAPTGTSRARRPRELHLSWGPYRSVGTGGCARIDDAAFHFPMPPLPCRLLPCLALPCQRPSPAWHHDFSWVLGPGSSFTN